MKEKLKAGDIIIIIGILLLALAVFLAFFIPSFKQTAMVLQISCDNEKTEYSLLEDRTFTIVSDGFTLVVCIEDGAVYIESSDCPDNTCVHTGRIDKAGEIIACAPAAVTLRIIGEEDGHDFVAG